MIVMTVMIIIVIRMLIIIIIIVVIIISNIMIIIISSSSSSSSGNDVIISIIIISIIVIIRKEQTLPTQDSPRPDQGDLLKWLCTRLAQAGVASIRHRLNGYLAQRVPSLFPAISFRMCLNCEVGKGMFPWRTRYPLS